MGEIRRYIRDNTAYRVSRSIKELSYAILSFKEKFQNEYGYEPNQTDIARALGINEYEVSYALESLTPTISIYEPVYQDDGEAIYLHDQLPDKKENNDLRDSYILLNESIEKLKEREKDILVKRYIVGKTQMELAKEYNISQAQVSRIEKSAIKSLKKMML
jgi:RNA polymerase sporulation-specific sigma factor